MTWHCITTAPTDRPILVGKWDIDGGPWMARVATRMTALEDGAVDWVYARRTGAEPIAFILQDVTHWTDIPAPPAAGKDDAFLTRMLAAASTGERVTAEDVAQLRRLADWADAAPPAGWNGTMNRGETQRAVDAARRKMGQ